MDQFSQRLTRLLAGRKIHPWAAALGVSKGAAETMGKGQVPGAEILRLIRLKEGASIGWLVTGDGSPFVVEHCAEPEWLAQQLAQAHTADGQPELHLFSDGQKFCLLLRCQAQLKYRQKTLAYHNHRLFRLAFREPPSSQLWEQCQRFCCWQHSLSSQHLQQLSIGELSPLTLLSQVRPGGKPLSDPSVLLHDAVQNSVQPSLISTELMRAVIMLVDNTAQEEQISLSAEQRARVYTATYRHAERCGLDASHLDSRQVSCLLDLL